MTTMHSPWLSFALIFISVSAATAASQEVRLGPPPRAFQAAPSGKISAQPPAAAQSVGGWLDTSNRAAVANSYQAVFVPTGSVEMGWTGSIASGSAGGTSAAYKSAVLAAVNWFRSMAGVPPTVALDAANSAKSQQAALMFSANRNLSHSPPSSWTYYTPEGAEAAGSSNICYHYSKASFMPGCMDAYMRDNGSNNYPVGHRRWILYPPTQTMGTGDVAATQASPQPYPYANALWVIDPNWSAGRPATRDSFVAWPPRGYTPYQVLYPRWSFSYPQADFSAASVSMRDGGGATVPLSLEPVSDGYGDNTIVWAPANALPAGPPAQDTAFDVTISGVVVGGQTRSFAYRVIAFDPGSTAPNTPPAPPPSPTPAFQAERPGVYRGGLWILARDGDGVFTPGTDRVFALGFPGATPVQGDWNGDGRDDSGVYAGGYWFLDYDGNGAWDGGVLDKAFPFGWAAARPVVGDWNGDGRDSVGVYANGFWFLDYNGDRAWDGGSTDKIFGMGWPGVELVIGDWNGDGRDKVGVFNQGYWFLDYDGSYFWDGGSVDKAFAFGWAGVKPVVGDWNGDGRDSAGAFSSGSWFLDYDGNGQWNAGADRNLTIGGPGSTPLVGDWNGDGRQSPGAFAAGTWFMDYDASGTWDAQLDRALTWGQVGDVPFAGAW